MVILSVCPSVLVSVMSQYHSKTRLDRDVGFSLYDSLVSLVFCDKISCYWVKGVPMNEREKDWHLFKEALFYR